MHRTTNNRLSNSKILGGFPQSEASGLSGATWWDGFGDPVLSGYVQEALKNNLELGAATRRVAQLYSRYGVQEAAILPDVDAKGQITRTKVSKGTQFGGFIPLRIESVSAVRAETTWEIDLWGRLRNAKNVAYSDFLSEAFNRRSLLMTLVANVVSTYFDLAAADRELEIAKSTLASREKSMSLAQMRFDQGFTSELDLRQSEALVAAAKVAIPSVSQRIVESENRLSLLLGKSSQSIQRGRLLDDLDYKDAIPTGLPSEVLLHKPDVLAAEFKLRAANYDVGMARAAFFPRVSLTGYFGNDSNYRTSHFFQEKTQVWQLVPSVTLPFLYSARLLDELEAQKMLRDESILNYKQAVLSSMAEVENAISGHTLLKDERTARADEIRVLRRYVELARIGYDGGEINYLDVLDAERNLFNSEVLFARSQGAYLKGCVTLYKALGGGWVNSADSQSITPKSEEKNEAS